MIKASMGLKCAKEPQNITRNMLYTEVKKRKKLVASGLCSNTETVM